jgi:hypothetical protein
MDKGIHYDIIFMDVQVRNGDVASLYHVVTSLLDAEYGRSAKYTSYSPDRVFRTHCCANCIRGREQHQGLHRFRNEHVPQVGSLCILHYPISGLTRNSKPIRRPALKQVLERFATIPEG